MYRHLFFCCVLDARLFFQKQQTMWWPLQRRLERAESWPSSCGALTAGTGEKSCCTWRERMTPPSRFTTWRRVTKVRESTQVNNVVVTAASFWESGNLAIILKGFHQDLLHRRRKKELLHIKGWRFRVATLKRLHEVERYLMKKFNKVRTRSKQYSDHDSIDSKRWAAGTSPGSS